MSFERFAVSPSNDEGLAREPVLRATLIDELRKVSRWDVLVVGGGIHGASFARLAALNGLRTLLVEKSDYANATSSRSSKMAHGGLRYLEMLDFKQVSEGVKSREELYHIAPHLVKPYDFFIPIERHQNWLKFKLKWGLRVYDWFVPRNSRKHHWIPESALAELGIEPDTASKLQGGYLYSDGIMDDTRLVLENIWAARQEGALCLNYFEFTSFSCQSDYVDVGCVDVLTKEKYSLRAGVVVNATGPWVAGAGRVTPSPLLSQKIRYSQGTHLLFDHQWKGPARFIPLGEPGRYYFVWPHPAGTLVGTTEREIESIVPDPLPSVSEVEEILGRLKKDLPGYSFDRSKLHYAFAGVRTLPLRASSKSGSAALSRRHRWLVKDQVLHLIGGKYTSANWTSYEGLRLLFKLSRMSRNPSPVTRRKLPGAGLLEESVSQFYEQAKCDGVSEFTIQSTVSRLGSAVRYLVSGDDRLEELGAGLLRQEVEYALDFEQAESLEDIMRRRVLCEYQPGNGRRFVEQVCTVLSQRRPGLDVTAEKSKYLSRLNRLDAILQGVSLDDQEDRPPSFRTE